jgi:hypothetical protein
MKVLLDDDSEPVEPANVNTWQGKESFTEIELVINSSDNRMHPSSPLAGGTEVFSAAIKPVTNARSC